MVVKSPTYSFVLFFIDQTLFRDENIMRIPLNQRSRMVGDFYGTGIEIWAGFGPVRQLLRPFFSCFHVQKKNLKTL